MRSKLLRLLFHVLRLSRPRTPASPPVFLILQYRIPLGCCVHATPLYAALKAAHPGCTLVVATHGLGLAVLQHDPHIDHLLESHDPGTSLRDLRDSAATLRTQLAQRHLQPTQVLQDASNRRGSLALFAALLRLAPTTGFANLPPLCDKHLAYDPHLSLIDNNLRLTGSGTPHVEPAVYFASADVQAAQALVQQVNPQRKPLTAFVVEGSRAQPNSWHDDRFAALLQHVESLGHRTVFLGTEAEAPTIDRIRALAGSSSHSLAGYSLAGRTTLPQLAAVLCLCDLLIAVDTGTLHVGRAAGLPMVVLAPSWQPAIEWLPLTVPNAIVLRGADTDPAAIPSSYRLDEITLDAAIAAFTALDSSLPPQSIHDDRIARLLSTTRP